MKRQNDAKRSYSKVYFKSVRPQMPVLLFLIKAETLRFIGARLG